jgi:hypothetical protein
MTANQIFDDDFATLWYHTEQKIVHHKIKKWIAGDNLRNLLNKGYEVIKKNNAQKWLSDDRNNSVLNPDDEKWAKTDWFVRMLKVGWKYWAIVLPEKVVGQMNIKRFSEDYSKAGITAKLFSDPDEALKWLESI